MATIGNGIPEKTIERLSEYRRTLLACHKQGITHIFSHVLAGIHGITAVQVPFLTLSMGQPPRPHGPLARRRALLAARQMRERGVRSAVFPVDFPYTALFLGQGICPVDTLPLRRALAAPLTRRKLESMGLGPTQAVVAVSAQRLIREAEDAVRSLALSFRYVLLSAGAGGEVLARELRREYGISLLLDPARDQLDRADALLLYAPRPDLAGDNAVLWGLYPGED